MDDLIITKGIKRNTYVAEYKKGRFFEITQEEDNTYSVSEFIPTGAYQSANGMEPSKQILNLLSDDSSPSKFYREMKRLGFEFDGIQRVSCDDPESLLNTPSLKDSRLLIESFLVADKWLHRRRDLVPEQESKRSPVTPLPKPDINDFNL